MLDLVKILPGLIKWKCICIDNNVFRLHYVATTFLLVAMSFLLSSRQYFGDPITCMTKSAVPTNVLNSYCWMFSTFSVKKHMQGEVAKDAAAHPGVGPYAEDEDDVVHHKYYQWVGVVLFCQAWLFYVPHYIWKRLEGGTVRLLIGDDLDFSLINDKWNEERKTKMADYLTGRRLHRRAMYAFKFVLAEVLNIANVVVQICFLNLFLGAKFFLYGPLAAQSYYTDEDPMTRLFPKVTKCTLHDFGPSGNVQNNDALCVLPLNILNERIFVFLWFWFFVLGFISILALFYRMTLLSRSVRLQVLATYTQFVERRKIKLIVEKCYYGDWFLLILLAKNMNPIIFHEFIEAVADNFEKKLRSTKVNVVANGGFNISRAKSAYGKSAEDLNITISRKTDGSKAFTVSMDDINGEMRGALEQNKMEKGRFMKMEDIREAGEQSNKFQYIEEVDNNTRDGISKRRVGDGTHKDIKNEHFEQFV